MNIPDIGKYNLKNIVLSKNTIILILLALMMVMGYFGYTYYGKFQSELASKTSLITGLTDDVSVERQKNGSLTATIRTIEGKEADMLLDINSKDETIQQLQNIIKTKDKRNNRLESALAIQSGLVAQYRDSLTNNNIVGGEMVGDTMYPTYERSFALMNEYDDKDSTKWVSGLVLLGKSDFSLDLEIVNKFDVSISRTRKNIFSKWEMYADVTTHNPYSNIKTVRSFSKQKIKPKRFGVGPSIGVGWANGGFGAYVGIGVNFNIIEF